MKNDLRKKAGGKGKLTIAINRLQSADKLKLLLTKDTINI